MADSVTKSETTEVESILESIPRIPEIQDLTLRFDTDWSGDPAVYISFVVRPDVLVDEVFVRKFLDYSESVQAKILHSGIDRFPYTDLQQAA